MPRAKRLKGLMREDAALDAMKQYGFSADLVKKKLKELLQTYGGDYGWTLIEDASYKLLIEVILEDDEPGDGTVKKENGGENEESAGFPDSHGEPDVYQLCVVEVSKINQPDEVPSNALTNVVCISVEKTTLGDHSDGQTAYHMRSDLDLSDNGNVSMHTDNVARHIGSDAKKTEFQYLQPCVEPPIRTRRKCYGWISNSDDEDDVIDLRKFKPNVLDGDSSGGAKKSGREKS